MPKKQNTETPHSPCETIKNFGEIFELDGTRFDWIIEGGKEKKKKDFRFSLYVIIDRSTSVVIHAKLYKQENGADYFRFLHECFSQHGMPRLLRTDSHAIFGGPKRKGKKQDKDKSQFLKVLTLHLKLSVKHARLSTGKPGVESIIGHLKRFLTPRLQEENISSREKANEFLPALLSEYNTEHARKPINSTDKTVKVSASALSALIWRSYKSLDKNWSFQKYNLMFWIKKTKETRKLQLIGNKVEFCEYGSGEFEVWHMGGKLPLNWKKKREVGEYPEPFISNGGLVIK